MQLNSPHPTVMRTGSPLAVVEGVRRTEIGKPDQWPPGSPLVRRRDTDSMGKVPSDGIPPKLESTIPISDSAFTPTGIFRNDSHCIAFDIEPTGCNRRPHKSRPAAYSQPASSPVIPTTFAPVSEPLFPVYDFRQCKTTART
jgi:hypothetical protein